MSKAQAHRRASQEFQVGDDSKFRTYLQNLQHPGQRTAIQDLVAISPQLEKIGWELAAEHKQRQIDAANAKQLGLDLDADDASSFATEKDTEYWTELEKLKGISFDSVEKSRQLFEKGIPRDYAVLGKNLTLIEQQNLRKQQYNTALAGLPGYVGKWTTAQFDDEGKLIPGLRIRLNDGRIVDATDETLSRADFAEVEEFITAKYLQPVLSSDGKGVEFQREHLNKPLAEIKAGLLKDHVKTANELSEYNDRQTYKNFLTQNAGKLTADDLGGMLSLSGLFTNDKGKPFSNAERQEYLTEFIKDLAKTSPDTARDLVQDMEDNGYTVGGVNKKFGSQRIDSLNEFINNELTTQENDDYKAFKAGSNSLGIQFRREYFAAEDDDSRNEIVKKYQGLYSELGPWATGIPEWITKAKNNMRADKDAQLAEYQSKGFVTQAEYDSAHPEIRDQLEGLLTKGKNFFGAKDFHGYKQRVESIKALVGKTDGAIKEGIISSNVVQETINYMVPAYDELFQHYVLNESMSGAAAHSQTMKDLEEALGSHTDADALAVNPFFQQYLGNGPAEGSLASQLHGRSKALNGLISLYDDDNVDWTKPWLDSKTKPDVAILGALDQRDLKSLHNYANNRGRSRFVDRAWIEFNIPSRNRQNIDKQTFARRLSESRGEVIAEKEGYENVKDMLEKLKGLYRWLAHDIKKAEAYPSPSKLIALRYAVNAHKGQMDLTSNTWGGIT